MAEMETPRTPELTEQEQIRRQKLQALMAAGQNPYTITCFDVTHRSEEITAQYDQLEGKTVSIAGRMTSRRIMGKAWMARVKSRSMSSATTWARRPTRPLSRTTWEISWA